MSEKMEIKKEKKTMKVSIDFSEFWMDEDSQSFNVEFKRYIVSEAVSKAMQAIKKDVQNTCLGTILP